MPAYLFLLSSPPFPVHSTFPLPPHLHSKRTMALMTILSAFYQGVKIPFEAMGSASDFCPAGSASELGLPNVGGGQTKGCVQAHPSTTALTNCQMRAKRPSHSPAAHGLGKRSLLACLVPLLCLCSVLPQEGEGESLGASVLLGQ